MNPSTEGHKRDLGLCLVTGASGFIGSHLVEILCEMGVRVRALVRYTSTGNRGWLDELPPEHAASVEFRLGDVRDGDQMRRLVDGCDTVLNLAALIGIPYSYEGPRQNLETNAGGALNLLEACRSSGVGKFVQISTSEVYGSAQYVPMDEAHPQVGQSPYSASKIAADQMTISYARSFGLPAMIVRPFNTFGPRQSLRAVIPTVVSQTLFDDRIRVGALSTRRDFTFVRDTASGIIEAARTTGLDGEAFNLGYGRDISIEELIGMIGDLVGRKLPVESVEERLRPTGSEVDRLCSDPRKAQAAFEWKPSHSLEEGLVETIDWVRRRSEYQGRAEFVV